MTTPAVSALPVAGVAGIEPAIAESKSAALPLGHTPIFKKLSLRGSAGAVAISPSQNSGTDPHRLRCTAAHFDAPGRYQEVRLQWNGLGISPHRANDGSRTRTTSLEGCCSAVKLHPHAGSLV